MISIGKMSVNYLEQAKNLGLFPYENPDVFIAEKPILEAVNLINKSNGIYTAASCGGHINRKVSGERIWLEFPQIILAVHDSKISNIHQIIDDLKSSLIKVEIYKDGGLMATDFPTKHPSWTYVNLVWSVNSYRDIQKSRLEINRIARDINGLSVK